MSTPLLPGLLVPCSIAVLLASCLATSGAHDEQHSAPPHSPTSAPLAAASAISVSNPLRQDAATAPHKTALTPASYPEKAPPGPPKPSLPPPNPSLLEHCTQPRSIVVEKAARRMELRCGEQVAARFGVSLGFAPKGHKHHEGDGRTPEGRYYITRKFVSRFHRSLELSYPNLDDAERGLADGQIDQAQYNRIQRQIRNCKRPPQTTDLGSVLQLHGGGGGPNLGDWTLGCVATSDTSIEAVYAFHQPGCTADGAPRTPVIVKP